MAKTSIFTADFHHQFQRETRSLLRERFLLFAGIVGSLVVVKGAAITWWWLAKDDPAALWPLAASVAQVAVIWGGFLAVYQKLVPERRLLDLTFWLLVAIGVTQVMVVQLVDQSSAFLTFVGLAVVHIAGSSLLPLSPRQVIFPAGLVLITNAGLAVCMWGITHLQNQSHEHGFWALLVWVCLASIAAVPGSLICSERHARRVERSKLGFLGRHYTELRRELYDAQRIHEALFPEPGVYSGVRLSYHYEPMRQIGGDFLFLAEPKTTDGGLSLVLLDVTGHGIAAALTVNRLHGELERIFAEDPDTSPGRALSLLNRYVHLTLSGHSVYLTAICLRVRPGEGTLEYANGGHPPAFVRGVDGRVRELDPTSYILGACRDDEFDDEMRTIPFTRGDVFLAYTDGATEARDERGAMLGINSIRAIMGVPGRTQRSLAESLIERVQLHREGLPSDDTLVVELSLDDTGTSAATQRAEAGYAPT